MTAEREARQRIARTAERVLAGYEDALEGCRAILALRHDANLDQDPAMVILIGIDTQTDHIPKGPARSRFSSDYLQKADKEEKELLSMVRPALDEALRNLRTLKH